jgi:hypothetical protein
MACTPVALVFAGDVFSYYHSNIDGKPVCCKVRARVVCRVVAGAASPTPLAVSREPSLRTLEPHPTRAVLRRMRRMCGVALSRAAVAFTCTPTRAACADGERH